MGKIKNSIKSFFKVVWTTFKIIYFILVLALLGVIGYIIYLLHPLYTELKPTIPDGFYKTDKISWTFFRYEKNPNVFQKLTIYQDGRNEVTVTRESGDFDIDMLGPIMPWEPRMDKTTGIITFKRKNVITKERASRVFRDAIKSGVLDITNAEHVKGATLLMEIEVGLDSKSVFGPDHVGSPIAYPPEKWINRIYWQQLTMLINSDTQLKALMSKVKYIKNKEQELNEAIKKTTGS